MPFLLLWHTRELDLCRILLIMVIRVVFGLDDNSPTCWKDIRVYVELIGLEEIAAKNRGYGQILPIG